MPPTGFKRSRALWDNARRPRPNKWDAVRPVLRAVLYEMQPVRFSSSTTSTSLSDAFVRFFRNAISAASHGLQRIPRVLAVIYQFLKGRSRREYLLALAVLVYYVVVRWIHYALDAGPIVLILTALVGIFTIGLGDETNPDGISAYSVFNRGFQRLLGTVDAEDLVAQQMMGGGMMGAGGGMMRRNAEGRDDGNILNPPPPPRRQPRAANAARQEEDENDSDGADDDDIDDDEDDDDDNDDNNQPNNNQNRQPQGRARLSGKKARRRNLEQRRELRRQREAALAMGFGADENAEALAMQRLLEEQIAENEDN